MAGLQPLYSARTPSSFTIFTPVFNCRQELAGAACSLLRGAEAAGSSTHQAWWLAAVWHSNLGQLHADLCNICSARHGRLSGNARWKWQLAQAVARSESIPAGRALPMGIVARLAMLTLTPLVTRPLTNLLDVWTATGACTIQHHVRGWPLPSALAVASHQLQAAVALTCPPASATCSLLQLPSGH